MSASEEINEINESTDDDDTSNFPIIKVSLDHDVLFNVNHQNEAPRPFEASIPERWDSNHVKMPFSVLKFSASEDPYLEKNESTDDDNTSNYFPIIKVAQDHDVLFNVNHQNEAPRPFEASIPERWDSNHVKMPFSVLKSHGRNNRWEAIKSALQKKIRNGGDLRSAIMKYNGTFENEWHFVSLLQYLNNNQNVHHIFKGLLPKMVKLAISLPEVMKAPLPLLKQGENKSVSLSQHQIASLLANAFFCTFPQRNTRTPGSVFASYSRINFCSLFNAQPTPAIFNKLHCIFHYFERVCDRLPTGVVTFSRRSLPFYQLPVWEHCDNLSDIPVEVDENTSIENANGLIQVNFANKFIGGGVLGRGLLQEEIRFLICPELIASMLIVENLTDTEALMVIGVERYCNYNGYGDSFKFMGDWSDRTPHDTSGRRQCALLAIDATHFNWTSQQFQPQYVTRELNKAYVGFSFFATSFETIQYPGVATGNWGCGAFKGEPLLKALIQLMACAVARRPMTYHTFGDKQLRDEILDMYRYLLVNEIPVGTIYKLLTSRNLRTRENLKSAITQLKKLTPRAPSPPLMDEDQECGSQELNYSNQGCKVRKSSTELDYSTKGKKYFATAANSRSPKKRKRNRRRPRRGNHQNSSSATSANAVKNQTPPDYQSDSDSESAGKDEGDIKSATDSHTTAPVDKQSATSLDLPLAQMDRNIIDQELINDYQSDSDSESAGKDEGDIKSATDSHTTAPVDKQSATSLDLPLAQMDRNIIDQELINVSTHRKSFSAYVRNKVQTFYNKIFGKSRKKRIIIV